MEIDEPSLCFPPGTLIILTSIGRAKRSLMTPVVTGIVCKTYELVTIGIYSATVMLPSGILTSMFEDEFDVLATL